MDLATRLAELQKRTVEHREVLLTEEAAKTALVMPFIQALGYDVFNPSEVVPEYTADVGTKKGEKVDYAICSGGIRSGSACGTRSPTALSCSTTTIARALPGCISTA
jgi:hypothetical protein